MEKKDNEEVLKEENEDLDMAGHRRERVTFRTRDGEKVSFLISRSYKKKK